MVSVYRSRRVQMFLHLTLANTAVSRMLPAVKMTDLTNTSAFIVIGTFASRACHGLLFYELFGSCARSSFFQSSSFCRSRCCVLFMSFFTAAPPSTARCETNRLGGNPFARRETLKPLKNIKWQNSMTRHQVVQGRTCSCIIDLRSVELRSPTRSFHPVPQRRTPHSLGWSFSVE